jgi:hypothetical protein
MKEKLIAEQKKLKAKMRRLNTQFHDASDRLAEIDRQLHRLEKREQLEPLIGVPQGVKCSYRRAPHERNAWLNSASGTLTKIGRTRAHVDFDSHGSWTFPLGDIVPATERQAVTIAAFAGGDWGDAP